MRASAEEQRLLELQRQAESWRGLQAKRPIESRTLAEKELAEFVTRSFREDVPPGALRQTEIALKAFGLIPEGLDLGTFLPRLLTQQVAGYYDPEEKALSLVRREGGDLGGSPEAGLDLQRAEDMVLIHELTHALQDQHFDLKTFLKAEDPMSDASTARQALVEGDATLTMLSALVGTPVEEMPELGSALEAAMGTSGALVAEGSDELFAEAPPFIQETLLFSYVQGNLFCLSVRRKGGQELLDRAFRQDPPRSTEQILHPEKWHSRRDDPIAVKWPDLAAALPGFAKASEGEMGELAIRILLREGMKNDARATAAAAGWGGDRFAVYEKDGRRLLAWITEWDSAEDAAEFVSAAGELGQGWRIERPAERRVVVLRGELTRRQERRVRAILLPAAPSPV